MLNQSTSQNFFANTLSDSNNSLDDLTKSPHDFCQDALTVIDIEANAVLELRHRINENFALVCAQLLKCSGRIIVTGMGKSGHIGKKIAATLASTGSPAFFVHPGEASHGDMGMITHTDMVIAISYSGETPELLTLLPLIKRLEVPLFSMTGNAASTLAKASQIHLDVHVEKEACPLDLAPTASTTVCLVLGDAIAVALLKARGFTAEDFARSHPGGRLGKRLLLLVDDLMHQGSDLPRVLSTTSVSNALIEMTQKKLGMTTVVDEHQQLAGVFTDGDLRRALSKRHYLDKVPISQVMTPHAHTLPQGTLAIEALAQMEHHKITTLVIVNSQNHPVGVIHLHDLLKAGVA